MGKSLSSETAAHSSVAYLASQKEENIQESFLDCKQKYTNVLVDTWIPQVKHFLLSACLLKAVCTLIAVLFYKLWIHTVTTLDQNILHYLKQRQLGKTVEELYQTTMHVTCIAHLLH